MQFIQECLQLKGVFELDNISTGCEITVYSDKITASTIYKELYSVRNIRPAFKYGQLFGLSLCCI